MENVAFQLHFVCTLFAQFVENHYLYIVIKRFFCVGLSRSQTFHATSLSSRLMIFAFILRLLEKAREFDPPAHAG
ncbi:hypothetical protein, partial [Prevotella sp. MGM2]|uniref:hypothetical protein n=1 Tax=Prevotella sp. MGM2 TaxID=2033406 RepID=UPI001CC0F1E3